ncbi:MAG: Clp1/GlmU family protein [Candidatus Methanomethylicaceae archaeon]
MKIDRGRSLLISGPAFMYLCEGALVALGRKIAAGEGFIVQKGKSVPIEPLYDSTIEIRLGSGAEIEYVDGVIPCDWKCAVDTILNSPRPIKALIIGDVDSGKTTFAAYLSNIALENGIKVAVVDADPGQAEISLPTTIGYGFLKSGITSMDQIPLESAFFIGSTSPADAPMRVIVGTCKLMEKALLDGTELIVINTCGWIYGKKAREYKTSLIQAVDPAFLITIQRGSEAELLIRVWEPIMASRILRITTSPASRVRSREERKERRENAYRKYFSKIKERVLDLQKVPLMHSYYTYGRPLPHSLLDDLQRHVCVRLLYGKGAEDFLFLVGEREPDSLKINKLIEITSTHDVVFIPKGFEKGILLGLHKPNGDFAGLGVLSSIDYEVRKVTLLTPIDDEIGIIEIGQLKLDESWREVAKLPHYPI